MALDLENEQEQKNLVKDLEEKEKKGDADRGDEPLRKEAEDKREDADLELGEIDKELEEEELKARKAKEDKTNEERIPKSRFDKAMANAQRKEEEYQRQVRELEARIGKDDPDAEYKKMRASREDLQDKYEEAVLDGKKDEAKRIRRELYSLEDQLDDIKANRTTSLAQRQALESLRYDAELARVEGTYPALNPDLDDYDQDSAQEVHDLMKGMAANGVESHVALRRAVKYVLGDAKPQDKGKAAEDGKARERAAREKAADAHKKQPADTSKVGLDSDKAGLKDVSSIDPTKLTLKQFDKLDEATRSQLRGDSL